MARALGARSAAALARPSQHDRPGRHRRRRRPWLSAPPRARQSRHARRGVQRCRAGSAAGAAHPRLSRHARLDVHARAPAGRRRLRRRELQHRHIQRARHPALRVSHPSQDRAHPRADAVAEDRHPRPLDGRPHRPVLRQEARRPRPRAQADHDGHAGSRDVGRARGRGHARPVVDLVVAAAAAQPVPGRARARLAAARDRGVHDRRGARLGGAAADHRSRAPTPRPSRSDTPASWFRKKSTAGSSTRCGRRRPSSSTSPSEPSGCAVSCAMCRSHTRILQLRGARSAASACS